MVACLPQGLAGKSSALSQLQAQDYADKYRGRGQLLYFVGIESNGETRTVAAFDVESA